MMRNGETTTLPSEPNQPSYGESETEQSQKPERKSAVQLLLEDMDRPLRPDMQELKNKYKRQRMEEEKK